jgi:hypothetical protein
MIGNWRDDVWRLCTEEIVPPRCEEQEGRENMVQTLEYQLKEKDVIKKNVVFVCVVF